MSGGRLLPPNPRISVSEQAVRACGRDEDHDKTQNKENLVKSLDLANLRPF